MQETSRVVGESATLSPLGLCYMDRKKRKKEMNKMCILWKGTKQEKDVQLLYKVLVEDAPEGYYRQLETTVNTDPTLSSIADSPPLDNDIEDESIQVQVSTQEEEEEDVKVELKGNLVWLFMYLLLIITFKFNLCSLFLEVQ